jgi:ATP-dependent helicase/DNAse subunit B
MYAYRPRGLFSEETAAALDTAEPKNSPAASMQRGKNGFYKSADVVPAKAIADRVGLVRETLRRAAEGMAAGCVDVEPLVEKRTLPCKWCDFAAVCRFERAMNGVRAAEAVLPRLPDDDEGDDA